MSGSYTLLLLGGGALTYGSSTPLSNWLVYPPGGSNVAISVSNVGALVASALFFVSAAFALAGVQLQTSKPRKSTAIVVYLVLLVLVASLAIVALQGVLPAFFIPGVGPTMLRQEVLGSAMVLFALSSIFFMRLYSKSKAEILYWFSLALALIVVGFSAWLLQHAVGDPLSWTGRISQFLCGVYLLIGALTTVRGKQTKETRP
jgi:heme/copper-type cytochrome/quinol oxidase subunit 4